MYCSLGAEKDGKRDHDEPRNRARSGVRTAPMEGGDQPPAATLSGAAARSAPIPGK